MRSLPLSIAAACLYAVIAVSDARGVVYVTKKDFVKNNMPAGLKMTKVTVSLTEEQIDELKEEQDWKGQSSEYVFIVGKDKDGNKQAGVCFLTVHATEHRCVHHLAIALNGDGTVKEVSVRELFCERAMAVASKSFLGQFGKKAKHPIALNEDISAVTGASESSREVVNAVNAVVTVYSSFVK
ncbi:MAG: FMN-binding protein [Chitinivibrionales bacterium]|nr:FMN-binding protein [Chitinivibrionales bacterium]